MEKHQTTIKEIAKALNVAISTVSRALQNDPRIGLRTKQRVQELAKSLHYRPNPAALLLKKNKTFTIGVVLPFLKEEFFSMAITGIEDVISEKGYNVFISQSRDSYEREIKAIKSFINSRVDGVIVSLSVETVNYQHFQELEEFGIPVVFFDRTPTNFPAHSVKCNVTEGAFQVVNHLVERGITKIALLNGAESMSVSTERYDGYIAALQKNNLDLRPEYIKFTNLTKEDTSAKMLELLSLKDKPQAIFAFNDYVALNAMQVCKQQGYIPNKDISFVSFANLPICSYMENPPIVSVEQFAYKMGEKAAQILVEVMNSTDIIDVFREELMDIEIHIHGKVESDKLKVISDK
jgi:DNA-binding LacI/PurR family transcriptional regulator